MMSGVRKRTWRAGLAGLVAATMALVGAGAASAASIDPTATADLTIHKYSEPDAATGAANNGLPVDMSAYPSAVPLAGVTFTIKQVPNIDLTTNDGWAAAAALSLDDAATAVASVAGTSVVTGADGVAAFTGLPLGLYYVEETNAPVGVTKAAPFLVTLPLTHPTELDAWLYDVHVYPKNEVNTAEKEVSDTTAVKVGDEIVWTITSSIPNNGVSAYLIVDELDSRLQYKSTLITLEPGNVTVTAGTHYTLTSPSTAGGTVRIEFTAAGRALLEANNTTDVVTKITTEVLSAGEIENTADVYTNQSDVDSDTPSIVTPTPESKFGNLTVHKVDENAADLAGAQFSVYLTEADARAGTNPIVIDGTSVWTSDASGLLTVSGLRYSNFADNEEFDETDARYRYYWLAEVGAPAGYELMTEPIRFTVLSDDTVVDLEVQNVPHNAGFTLPLTGGPGLFLVVLAGIALITGAVLVTTRARRNTAAVPA